MVQVNIKSVYDVIQDIVNQAQNVDLTHYPDELKFLDAGKVGGDWGYLDDPDSKQYSKCFARCKHDDADKWQAFDEILKLIQWVAEGKYRNFPPPPREDRPWRYYRLTSLVSSEVLIGDHLPAQLRVSTPGTYLGPSPEHYIHVKIEQKLAGNTVWQEGEELGLHDVLKTLESGAYGMVETDSDKAERIFRRLF